MTQRVFFDAQQFNPTAHRVRLHQPGNRRWEDQGYWTVGLDWRPGAPTFLSMLSLTTMYRRLAQLFDLHKRNAEAFQLQVTAVSEDGREGESWYFVPTMPIDDLDDEQEFRRWITATAT